MEGLGRTRGAVTRLQLTLLGIGRGNSCREPTETPPQRLRHTGSTGLGNIGGPFSGEQ
jgi:hypothetical protein